MEQKWYLQTWFICILVFLWPLCFPTIIATILIFIQHFDNKKTLFEVTSYDKWYLQTWFICILVLFWPLCFPAFIAIILIFIQHFENKKIFSELTNYDNLKANNSNLQPSISINRNDESEHKIYGDYLSGLKSPSDSNENNFDSMSGYEFEQYCATLLRFNGYQEVEVTQSSGDYGVDILTIRDNIKYAIQCKCYTSDVGVNAIYQIAGGMKYYDANIGIVMINRYFTTPAQELAKNIGVVLWDRDKLLQFVDTYAKAQQKHS